MAEKREGGVNIGGNASVGGDVVGRDKTTTMGLTGDQVAKLFEPLTTSVRQSAPPDKVDEAMQKIAELEAQVKSKSPNMGVVGQTLKWLKKNVPGVSAALNTVLGQPIVGQAIKDIAAVVLEE